MDCQLLKAEIQHLRCIIDAKRVLSFGKYKGCTYAQIRRRDFEYCDWILNKRTQDLETKHFQNWLRLTCSITFIRSSHNYKVRDAVQDLETFVSSPPALKYENELAGLF